MADTRALRKDAGQQQTPYHNKVFREFAGINTQAKRQAIQPGEFAWIENIMPVGHGNLIILPARSAALATVPNGSCYYMKAYNLNGVNYMFMATDTGHAYQVQLSSPYTRTEITSAGSPQFGNSGLQIDQWKNERILIADPGSGYWSWDGTILTGNGTLTQVFVTDGGSYTAIPAVSFVGGGGSGAVASAIVGISGGQTISNPGTGYTAGDIITLDGGSFTSPGKLTVISVGGGGDITAVAVFDPGAYDGLAPPPVTVSGGTGTGATITPNYAVLSVAVIDGGNIPYSDPPEVVFTASGATGLSGDQVIAAGGTGYLPGDILTLTGGTFTSPGKLRVLTTLAGAVNSVDINDRGSYTVEPAAPVASTGGGADDATFTPNFAGLTARATALIISGPAAPTHVATFAGRAWLSVNRTLFYSAPDDWSDFVGAGSGFTIITDSTLHSEITQLLSANNFLYFTGVDSVNVIGDVNVNSLGDTIFSNVNLSASIGTELPLTIIPYFRSVLLANKSGVYAIFGSTPTKASDPLDGIFRKIDFDGDVCAGTVMLENILCAAFIFQYRDVAAAITRPLMAIFFNRKWFVASQGDGLKIIAGGEEGGLQNLYATDGASLYRLFDDTDTPVAWELQTAYWDMDDVTRGKEVNAFGFEADVPSTTGLVSFNIDMLSNQQPYVDTQNYEVGIFGSIDWINDALGVVDWVNNSGTVTEWAGGGYVLQMQDGEGFGKYIGVTMSSEVVRGSLSSILLRYIYRDSW